MADSIRILDSRNPDDLDTPRLSPERVYNTFHVSPALRQKAYEINLELQGKTPTDGKALWEDKLARARKTYGTPKAPQTMPALRGQHGAAPIAGHVYIIQAGDYYKIGATARIEARLKELAYLPNFTRTVMTIPLDDAFRHERKLHNLFVKKWVYGEWFALTDADLGRIRRMYERKAA